MDWPACRKCRSILLPAFAGTTKTVLDQRFPGGRCCLAEDMLRADPRLRVQTAIALVAATIVALIALFGFQSWLENIGQLPGNDLLILKLRRMIGAAMTGSAICLAMLAWYATHKAAGIHAHEQWPLPGTRVLRDTRILRGEAALRMARWLRIASLVLMLLVIGIGITSWRMMSD